MSIESLCTGDTVVVQEAQNTPGQLGGNDPDWQDVTPAVQWDLRIDTTSASESTKYAARNSRFTHEAFLSHAPDVNANRLTTNYRLKWTARKGHTFPVPRFLRVLAWYFNDNAPEGGDLQLWIVDLEEEQGRQET